MMDDQPTAPPPPAPQPHAAPQEGAAQVPCSAASGAASPPDATRAPRHRRPPGRPWGFWATLGWTALWLLVWFLVSVAGVTVCVIAMVATDPSADPAKVAGTLERNGLLLSLIVIVQTPVLVGLTALLAWVRMPLREYLALRPLRWKATAVCVLLLLLLLASQDTLTWLTGQEVVPPVMVDAYRTAGFLPLLAFALIVAAPVVEETFFRGFMYTSLAASRVGHVGAVLLTAAVWALIHFQYGWFGIACIFVDGLFLGLVRWRTGSATLTTVLHAITNLVAMAELMVVAGAMG